LFKPQRRKDAKSAKNKPQKAQNGTEENEIKKWWSPFCF